MISTSMELDATVELDVDGETHVPLFTFKPRSEGAYGMTWHATVMDIGNASASMLTGGAALWQVTGGGVVVPVEGNTPAFIGDGSVQLFGYEITNVGDVAMLTARSGGGNARKLYRVRARARVDFVPAW